MNEQTAIDLPSREGAALTGDPDEAAPTAAPGKDVGNDTGGLAPGDRAMIPLDDIKADEDVQ
jgi:hypothetical protein